jgi:hypothetical protein
MGDAAMGDALLYVTAVGAAFYLVALLTILR